MKYYYLLLLFIGAFSADAQLILNPRFFGAHVVLSNKDTLRGTVKLPKSAAKGDFSYTDIMWKMRFTDIHGVEYKFKPNDIRQFTFWLENGKQITFVSRPNTVKAFAGLMNENENMFLEVVQDGHIKILKGYFYNATAEGDPTSSISYIQKGHGPIKRFRHRFFRFDLIDYVKDNSELVKKIKERQYQPDEIDQIVKEYNLWYAENKH